MVSLGLFFILIIVMTVLILMVLINSMIVMVKKTKTLQATAAIKRIKKGGGLILFLLLISGLLIFISQVRASTPKIQQAGSIAELRKIEVNGRKEWISLRGENKKNPLILFLAGGPGGSQLAATRYELAELEKNFVVVNWEQPGAGKSYYAAGNQKLTPEHYVQDGIALTKQLLKEFQQEKLIVIGESWGSALGIFMIQQMPQLFHSFIGTGQMVDFKETEILDYRLAIQLAEEANDQKLVRKLKENGEPPYYGRDVTWKSAAYLNYLSSQMTHNPNIQNSGYNTMRDLAASEYGVLDKINYVRGIITTFNQVYPQLYETDLRQMYSKLSVPVYFFLGRHDINAPTELVEGYCERLEAPHKEIVWFEHSGHSPWINEAEKFVEQVERVSEQSGR